MKTVGQILRETRESKGLTVAQAVEGTRSKSQVIQQLEQDDFSRFPAPIYTRGFIKLYAEFLGLDASELISLYQARNAEADKLHRPGSVLRPGSHQPPPAPAPVMTSELELPLPVPPPEPAELISQEEPSTPAPVAKPRVAELELSFDAPVSPAPPPKRAPVLQDAPRALPPVVAAPPPEKPSIPNRKPPTPKPSAPSAGPDEFTLEVREGVASSTSRERAASIFALARISAGRVSWRKIMTRAGLVIGVLLLVWLCLSVIRGCVSRHQAGAVKSEESAAPYNPPPVPEPPPLYLQDTPLHR